ncbi:hypothetical protein V8C44DRAFT_345418, partial [Trichoderma aethiopicum]
MFFITMQLCSMWALESCHAFNKVLDRILVSLVSSHRRHQHYHDGHWSKLGPRAGLFFKPPDRTRIERGAAWRRKRAVEHEAL